MGEIRNIQCKTCGHIWSRTEGRGFRAVSLHCGHCGTEKIVNIDDANLGHICECGGKLTAGNKKIVCPKCQSNQTKHADDVVMMWD